jgi:hypothetical protein
VAVVETKTQNHATTFNDSNYSNYHYQSRELGWIVFRLRPEIKPSDACFRVFFMWFLNHFFITNSTKTKQIISGSTLGGNTVRIIGTDNNGGY